MSKPTADTAPNAAKGAPAVPVNFLRPIVQADLDSGKHSSIVTRFPPEPNGYLHIGHAKSICVNFGLAKEFGGACHLRFDDTNPAKEDQEYIDAIQEDVKWLGFEWTGPVRYASEYFDQLHAWAVDLITSGNAYVCDLTPEQAKEYRGNLTEPGKNSPFRERSVEENLDLFARMKAGEFKDGERVLRAKIDMASPNMNLRDPILYRIRHAHHHQTGDKWCIYPNYDFTHGQSDAIEGITHSICTLEFEGHRPLYEWFLDHLPVPTKPRQYEFSRLNLNYTITSKRKLKQLVDEKHVEGWDDPRMSTLSGFRRRGYTPASIRNFCEMIGTNRSDGVVDMSMLEFSIRDDLDRNAPRAMCVLRPLKVVITNYPEGQVEQLELPRHPKEDMGVRVLPFARELYIDRDDFMEEPPKGYKRLEPAGEVRLRGSYVIRADEAIKDADGNIVELRCSYDPDTLGKNPEGRKVKGVIHWVPAEGSVECEVRLYDRLFRAANPEKAEEGGSFLDNINPDSLQVLSGCRAEPSLGNAQPEDRFQFEREGYFCADLKDSRPGRPVFNRTVSLRDSWGSGGIFVLNIYNTLSKTKEVFKPLDGNKVRMYVCGMTVYDFCHLGHGRSMVAFDLVTRWLRYSGYDLTYVRNITDIDDKIINRANENGETFDALTARMIDAMHEDERRLNILPPDLEPRATDHIPGMHAMIQTLIDKGYAYAPGNGDVYYRVGKFVGYGKLSRKKIEDLRIGARIEVDEAKQDPLDFVLWKGVKPGEPSWESPWGPGRPGWHIECSVMSTCCLGESFDIHGGGSDLEFPHHENEIAQSEAATGKQYANSWMHCGMIRINGEKMSKSLNNFFTIRDVLDKYHPEVVRYLLVSSHYRSAINYSEDSLRDSKGALERFYHALRGLPLVAPQGGEEYVERFAAAMNDDFGTPEACAVLFDLVREINRLRESDAQAAAGLAGRLRELGGLLGVLQLEADEFLRAGAEGKVDAAEVEALIQARLQARAEKNWAESDRIRDQIAAMGVVLEDKKGETTWRLAD